MFILAAKLWFPLYMSIFFGVDVPSIMAAAYSPPTKSE